MLITSDGIIHQEDDVEMLKRNGFEYYWSGLVWTRGKVAGLDSVLQVAECVEQSERIPFDSLYGAFFMAIRWPDGTLSALTDNSGMHTMSVSDLAISTGFLSLTRYLGDRISLSLDRQAVAETYSLGRVLSSRTMIEQIRLSDKYSYLQVKDGRIESLPKGVLDIEQGGESFNVLQFFDDLAHALSRSQVSVALTGGYDSRMVFAFLKNRMAVSPCLSGDRGDHPEAVVARRVANEAGHTLVMLDTRKPDVSDRALEQLFFAYDGLSSFTESSAFRLRDFYSQLALRGIDTHVTGDGGVLHKDWEWMQDLPFYHKRKTNLEKFYRQRLAFNYDASHAGPFMLEELSDMKRRVLTDLSQYVRGINTQSYDMLYYHVNGRRDRLYNLRIGGVSLYAPLMERDFVSYSYSLPRRHRFYYINMRRLTTGEDTAIAQIPTVYGTTESSEWNYMLRDAIFQLADYGRKYVRMTGRRILGRNVLTDSPTSWSIEDDLRELSLSRDAIKFCRHAAILDDSASIRSLSSSHLGARDTDHDDCSNSGNFRGRRGVVPGSSRPSHGQPRKHQPWAVTTSHPQLAGLAGCQSRPLPPPTPSQNTQGHSRAQPRKCRRPTPNRLTGPAVHNGFEKGEHCSYYL